MRSALLLAMILLIACRPPWACAQVTALDEFESLDAWRVIASDGVDAHLSLVEGLAGQALRLDFDFRAGAGFCVIHRDTELPLPPNYRFCFSIRGQAPPNNLEFKLVDPSGDNVWWVNRRNFEFPRQWQTLSSRARQFRFAWGPSGGKPLETLGAIELAVAASTGGRGYILIDRLTFERLPETQAAPRAAVVYFSSQRTPEQPESAPLEEGASLAWRSAAADEAPWLRIDFQQLREFGGLSMDWDEDDYAAAYDIAISPDGQRWEPVATVARARPGRDYVPLSEALGSQLRFRVQRTSRGQGVHVRSLRIMGPEFGESPNSMYATIARDAPRGWFPRYFLGEQQPWTIVGVAGDAKEALLDTDGAIEVDKLGFRLEPFLWVDGRLITWADITACPSLAEDYLPIPSVRWRAGDWELEVTACADGPAGASTLLARYRVVNHGAQPGRAALFVALRPFQVLPPWQELNITGGVSTVDSIAWDGRRVVVNDQKAVQPWTPPGAFGAAAFAQGDIVEYLSTGKLPAAGSVSDPARRASAAFRYDLDPAPGAARAAILAVPFFDAPPAPPSVSSEAAADERFSQALDRVGKAWTTELNRAGLSLPPQAARLVHTFKTTQAYILINADGPAIQPGSRTYERSWIRDGALTSTALLSTGHPEAVRAFLEWYSRFQYPSGKVPCVVDRRGADPVPEHDSTGELIYALRKYYLFTRDRAFLEAHLPQVVAGVDYLGALRRERLTAAYRDGPPELRACYGLVPESISHEGYSAKPMHSYWDSFFVMRGLKDAARIAQTLGRDDLAQRFGTLRDDYRAALHESIRLAMLNNGIDYLPGCVELGDFDATSTAIALFPCEESDGLPAAAVRNTFSKYFEFFRNRRDGTPSWENYTPYELRLIGTFVRLGQPKRAYELLDFFMQDQRPQGWNQWAEVVWRDPATPRFIGDMPHTWVGSEFLNAVRSMFVYERERDSALVLAAGVRPEWLASFEGAAVTDWPTEYGTVSYTLRSEGPRVLLNLSASGELPPGGFVFHSPLEGRVATVEADGQAVDTGGQPDVTVRTLHSHVTVTHAP